MEYYLSDLRIGKELTQKQFAEAMGYGLSRVGMWEAGQRKPNITEVNRMAEFFGVHSEEIIFKRKFHDKRNRLPKKSA